MQRLRHGQALPSLDRHARPLQRSNDLEGVERVPPGRLVHLGENRARKRDPQVVVHHAVECTHVEGANFDIGHAFRGKRTPQFGEQSALQWSAASQENADPLGTQPPRRIAERRGGSGVEPLHVVDGHDKRSVLGKSTQRAENGDSHGALVGSRPLVLLEHERTGQCAALRIGQRSKCLVEHSVEQVAYSRERQRGLALRRTRLENPKSLLLSLRDARTPDRRLADPRLAFQQERPAELQAEEDGRRDRAVGDVVVRPERLLDLFDRSEAGGPFSLGIAHGVRV